MKNTPTKATTTITVRRSTLAKLFRIYGATPAECIAILRKALEAGAAKHASRKGGRSRK